MSVDDTKVAGDSSQSRAALPVAPALLERGPEAWRWRVACPFGCIFKFHVHGGGWLSDSPERFLGHRAHLDGGPGYLLVDANPERTAQLVAAVRAELAANPRLSVPLQRRRG